MDFKQLVMNEVDTKYQEMSNGTTDKPFSQTPAVSSSSAYEKKRDDYYRRLNHEHSEFNKAVNQIIATRNARAKDEDQRRREKERKRAERSVAAKKFISIILVLAIIGGALAAFFGFVIWPNMIYPNLPNEDLNTPEIVQTYCYSSSKKDVLFTITECTADGQVKATLEVISDGEYDKTNLTGRIVEKKNNGDVVIEWTSNSGGTMSDASSDLTSTSISKEWTVVKLGTLTMEAGTNDEYTIDSADDFQKLSNSSGTYYLKNDIDLGGVNWTPIEGFSGKLLGNGYSINNLKIDTDGSNVGFFATLDGTVQNLRFGNASITVSGRNENVGILCGNLKGNAINISVSGTVNASKCNNVGGVFGYAGRSISHELDLSDLTSSAVVSGLNKVGGIAGYLYAEYVDICVDAFANSGEITAAENYAGGIIGCIDVGDWDIVEIFDCENIGDVKGTYYVGGIVGYARSKDYEVSVIDNSYCKANISGEAYVGCIAGKLSSILINNCKNEGSTLTATGSISEDDKRCAYVGGFVGAGCGVTNCTNEVEIKYTGGGSYVGGIIGHASMSISPDHLTFKSVANNAPVSGADYVGGIAGHLFCEYITLQVEDATNTANVSGSGDYVGGIIGFGSSTDYYSHFYIYDSDNSGNITGRNYVGGIVGYGRARDDESVISGCTSTGSVKGSSKTGNIAGELKAMVIE